LILIFFSEPSIAEDLFVPITVIDHFQSVDCGILTRK